MRRHHYKAFDGSAGRIQTAVVSPGAGLRCERYSASPASTTWHDVTASANNGTATDAAIFTDFGFDGVTDSVELSALDASADLSQPFTVAFWYKRNITGATGASTLIGNRKLSPAGGWLVRDLSGGGLADFSWETSLGPTTNYGTILPGTDGDWHLGCIVWAPGSPNTVTAYADGVVYQTRTSTAGNSTGQAMWIARSFYNYFYGNIDTVRVYPRALSADEIKRDYYAGKPVHP